MSRFIGTLILIASISLTTGCAQLEATAGGVGRLFGGLGDTARGRTPRAAVVKMEDQYFPDERREGINELVSKDFGKRPPYTERYQQIAQSDSDWLVRATAIRALNRARDRSATDLFVSALSDQHEQVRLEAAKALVHMPDDAAIAPLVRMVQNPGEFRDVRLAAADALKHYRTLEVARALSSTLGGRDFGLAWQARQSLIYLTGRDLAYDEAAWLAYLTSESPFG